MEPTWWRRLRPQKKGGSGSAGFLASPCRQALKGDFKRPRKERLRSLAALRSPQAHTLPCYSLPVELQAASPERETLPD